jgi:Secretion system C-terminal sorting domain
MKKNLYRIFTLLILCLSNNIVYSQPPPTFTLNIVIDQPNCNSAGIVTASSQINIICKYYLSDSLNNYIDSNTTGVFTGLLTGTYYVSGRECITNQLSVPNTVFVDYPAPVIVPSPNPYIVNPTNGMNGSVQFVNNYFSYGAIQYIYNVLTPSVKINGGNVNDLYFPNLTPGNYMLHQQYPNFNCGVNDQAFTIGGAPLSVNSESNKEILNFNIHPNPAKNNFNINSNVHPRLITITSTTGKVLQSWQPDLNNNYPLLNIAPGLYFIKVKTANNTCVQKILID